MILDAIKFCSCLRQVCSLSFEMLLAPCSHQPVPPATSNMQKSLHTGVLCEERSADELADATGGADATLSFSGELLGADNARDVGDLALTEDLEVTLQQNNRLLFNKKKLTAATTSITTAFFSVEALRDSSETRVHSLSTFTVGMKYWFLL